MPPRIFISYRREDASGEAGRLADHMNRRFGRGQVFLDIDTIDPGTDFVRVLQSSLRETAAGTRRDRAAMDISPRQCRRAQARQRDRLRAPRSRGIAQSRHSGRPCAGAERGNATASGASAVDGIAHDAPGSHTRSRGVPRRRESAVRSPREDARTPDGLTVVGGEAMVAGGSRWPSCSRAHRLFRDAHARAESCGPIDRWNERDEHGRSLDDRNDQARGRAVLPKDSRPRRRLSAGAISTTRRW